MAPAEDKVKKSKDKAEKAAKGEKVRKQWRLHLCSAVQAVPACVPAWQRCGMHWTRRQRACPHPASAAAVRRQPPLPPAAGDPLARCRLQDKKDKGEKKEKKEKSEKKDKDKSEKKDKSERCRGGGGRLAARRQRLQCAAARYPVHPRHLQDSWAGVQVLRCQARQACGTAAQSAARLPAASTCRLHSTICAGDKKDKKSASDKLAEHKVSADGKHSSKSKAGAAPAKPAPPARPAPRRPPKPEPQVGAGLGTLWAVEHGLLGRVGWPMCQLLLPPHCCIAA